MSDNVDALVRDGVVLARTTEGYDLPVIDVTHPRFAVPEDDDSIEALRQAFMEYERRQARVPRFLMRWMIASAARRSRFLNGVFRPGGDVPRRAHHLRHETGRSEPPASLRQ